MKQDVQSSILSYMSEGLMVIGLGGVIEQVNDAAIEIFEKPREELEGKRFARTFFDETLDGENDEFIQSVLDAVYNKGRRQESYTPYTVGGRVKQLRTVSSCLKDEDSVSVILVISDITELTEMRDAVKAMNRINSLNQQLELRNRVLQETFGRYLSDEIVKEILDSPEGWKLGGQKQKLTIMMTDLRGFTAMCERMNPQDLIGMLNHYFSEMYEEISRYNGTLIEFLGDGMMVIFGAPIRRESHASDAVAAAVAMQRRMKAVNRWNIENGYDELAMGIGINTDEVILGNIGSERRIKYGVMGAPVNLAGRIESYTTEGQVLISPYTRELIEEELTVVQSFEIVPKGVKEPLTISEVSGIGAPYEEFVEKDQDTLRSLKAPVPVKYCALDGKHVDDRLREGEILKTSGKHALLRTDAILEVFDNIRLDIGEDLYAKVSEKEGKDYLISFTSRPKRFEEWLSEIAG